VPRSKIEIGPLGVDTELFHPVRSALEEKERAAARARWSFSDDQIVCIYTGRFTEDKNPLLLAKAVAELQERGEKYRGLFVGNGPQAEALRMARGCITLPFVPVQELGALFRASDIGVWPGQESLSMLDAAACGLAIIVNHTLNAPERIAGNGKAYRLNDLDDLLRALTELKDRTKRDEMGRIGSLKMARDFSWEAVARARLKVYEAAADRRRYAPAAPPQSLSPNGSLDQVRRTFFSSQ
jgi:glycosyltransferase involved in cell wall biosynthesis